MGGIHDPRWDNIDGPVPVGEHLPDVAVVLDAGAWDKDKKIGEISLVFDQRHRRRLRMEADDGKPFLLNLPVAMALNHGDGLPLNTGEIIEVIAAPEPLMEVRATDALHLLRLAWHIGNRHLPAMIKPDVIYIRPDHVIQDMLEGLGARVRAVQGPFQPEGGAYAPESKHDHGHDH